MVSSPALWGGPAPASPTTAPNVCIFPDVVSTFSRSQKQPKMGASKNLPKSQKSNPWRPQLGLWMILDDFSVWFCFRLLRHQKSIL